MTLVDTIILELENNQQITDIVGNNIFPIFDPTAQCDSLASLEAFHPHIIVTKTNQDDLACGDEYSNSAIADIRIESRGLVKFTDLRDDNPELRNKSKAQIDVIRDIIIMEFCLVSLRLLKPMLLV